MTDPVPGGLPAGYALRRPRGDDLDEVVALIAAADLAASGETCASRDDLLAEWGQARFELERHAWLVTAADGRPAAYAWVFDSADHTCIDGQFLVHPAHQWRGLEAPLLEWVERSATVPMAAAVAPPPIRAASTIVTRRPSRARARAQAAPTIPAPTITTSFEMLMEGRRECHGRTDRGDRAGASFRR